MSKLENINNRYAPKAVVDGGKLDTYLASGDLNDDTAGAAGETGITNIKTFMAALGNTQFRNTVADQLQFSHSDISHEYGKMISQLSIRNKAILEPKQYMEDELRSLTDIDRQVSTEYRTELTALVSKNIQRKEAKILAESRARQTLKYLFNVHELTFPSQYNQLAIGTKSQKNDALRTVRRKGGNENGDLDDDMDRL